MTSSQTNSQKILEYLKNSNGEVSNIALSRDIGIDKSNIPREIKRLEGQGNTITKRREQVGRSRFVWFSLSNSHKKTNSKTITHPELTNAKKELTISKTKAKQILKDIDSYPTLPKRREAQILTSNKIIRVMIGKLNPLEQLTPDEERLRQILTSPRGHEHRNKRWQYGAIKIALDLLIEKGWVKIPREES